MGVIDHLIAGFFREVIHFAVLVLSEDMMLASWKQWLHLF
jgi:hypothetical protein